MISNTSLRGWVWTTIGATASVTGGITKNSGKTGRPLKRPYLRVANVYANELRLDDVSELDVDANEARRAQLVTGDLLVVEGNGSIDQIGRVARWNGAIEPCLHQNHLIKIRFSPRELGRWCLYWLLSPKGREAVVRAASSTSGLHTLSLSKVESLGVPIAPMCEQARALDAIETQLTRLDAAVAALERVQANLKRYRASVLKAAVEGRLVPTEAELARREGRDYEPASVLLQRILAERRRRWEEAELAAMRKSGRTRAGESWKAKYRDPIAPTVEALPEIPDGWKWTTVDAVAELQTGLAKGKARRKDQALRAVPYLRVANVQRGWLDLSEVKEIEATEEEIQILRLMPGDVLLNEGGDRDKLGRGWVWGGELPTCIHQNHVHRARPLAKDLSSKFLSWYANTEGQQYFVREGKQTTNLASVSMSTLRILPFPLPPAPEQKRIEVEVDRILSIVDDQERLSAQLRRRADALRQSILKWAFEGKLVDQDPNDEPVCVLLERIRAERAASAAAKPVRARSPRAKKERVEKQRVGRARAAARN